MIYSLAVIFFKSFFKLFFRTRLIGIENIPVDGPLIFAANHSSYADPPLIGSSVKRPVYFIAKKELFDVPLLNWLIEKMHAFPVDRGTADISALKNAIKILTAGNALLIFPEGTRYKKGKKIKLKNGAAMLAVATGAYVVPVAILNSDRLFKMPRLILKFGVPVKFGAGRDYRSITEEIMSRIESLKTGSPAADDSTAYGNNAKNEDNNSK